MALLPAFHGRKFSCQAYPGLADGLLAPNKAAGIPVHSLTASLRLLRRVADFTLEDRAFFMTAHNIAAFGNDAAFRRQMGMSTSLELNGKIFLLLTVSGGWHCFQPAQQAISWGHFSGLMLGWQTNEKGASGYFHA